MAATTTATSSSSSSTVSKVLSQWNPITDMVPSKWAVSTAADRQAMLSHYNTQRSVWRQDPRYRTTIVQHFIEDVHDGFRNYCNSLVVSYQTKKRVPLKEFSSLIQHLEGHHQAEDAAFFPRAARRNPELRSPFAYLEKDHKHLHPLELAVKEGSGEALMEFTSFLVDHLNREEMLIVPYMLSGTF